MGKKLVILFFLLSVFNLYAVATQWQSGIYFSKPFLMTVLAAWFYMHTKNNFTVFSKFILAGIVFSIGGDTFLMFVDKNPAFFLAGLGSFLITQLLYIFAFINFREFKNGFIINKKWMALPVVAYLLSFVYYLIPDIPDAYLIPVLIYSLIISTMLANAINMRGRVGEKEATGIIVGALLFVISDSCIAINKFKNPGISAEIMGVIIMTTYLLGQYLIVFHAVKTNNKTVRSTDLYSSIIMGSPK
ncbi:MAG: lysoplasmalogenase [Bacteroidota bacterium]